MFSAFTGVDLKSMGIPSERELVDMYCRRMNIPVIDNWDFYVAFNFFRFAAILQGVYKRAISGRYLCGKSGWYQWVISGSY